jgi:ribosomal protein L24
MESVLLKKFKTLDELAQKKVFIEMLDLINEKHERKSNELPHVTEQDIIDREKELNSGNMRLISQEENRKVIRSRFGI